MMQQRAYSTFKLKNVNLDKREIVGLASSPSTDRMGDIVVQEGAVMNLPVPFLLQHDVERPLGSVVSAKQTSDGILIKATIAKPDTPGPLADRLSEAWDSIRLGLIRGLSIGFQPIESEPIGRTGGTKFKRWSLLEVSAVTIAANADASILEVKRADLQSMKAQTSRGIRNEDERAAFQKRYKDACARAHEFVAEICGDSKANRDSVYLLAFLRELTLWSSGETDYLLTKRLDRIEQMLAALSDRP